MFSDEVEYVWKKEKTWRESHPIPSQDDLDDCTVFWLYIMVRICQVVGLDWLLSAL